MKESKLQDTRMDILGNIITQGFSPGVTVLNVHRLGPELSIDSLDFIELILGIEDEFKVDIPHGAIEFNDELIVQDLLDHLRKLLGPEFPNSDNVLALTEDQFINRYRPEEDRGALYVQRDWFDINDRDLLNQAIDEKRCWTAVDTDDGEDITFRWGNATVNRVYNIIVEVPIEDENWEVNITTD